MSTFIKNLKRNSILRKLSSLKITVFCLSLLFILTLWGTIAQVDQGLYQAQETFFNSWFFTVLDFIPFPGAQLVLWILFINLACVSVTRFVYKLSHLGIVVTHIGLLMYFVSAFVTLQVVEESNLTLMEGDGSNVSASYHHWELSVWKHNSSQERTVTAFDSNHFKSGQELTMNNIPFKIRVNTYLSNAKAYTTNVTESETAYINDSGIKGLLPNKIETEPEKNFPGGTFSLKGDQGKTHELLLYGGESEPTQITYNNEAFNIILRRKRHQLPITVTLKEFEMDVHPGTEIASRYQSLVQVQHEGINRDVLIYMNNPLRYKNYTFYQASYAIDNLGRELSTLAVVKNSGQWLPYISSAVTFVGLVIHFLFMGTLSRKYKRA